MIPHRYLEALKRLLKAQTYTRSPQGTTKTEPKSLATERNSK